jgi:hypothetical protein
VAERSTRGTGVITSLNRETGSNLADTGRARRVLLSSVNGGNPGEALLPTWEAMLNACGAGMAGPLGQSLSGAKIWPGSVTCDDVWS